MCDVIGHVIYTTSPSRVECYKRRFTRLDDVVNKWPYDVAYKTRLDKIVCYTRLDDVANNTIIVDVEQHKFTTSSIIV